MAKKRGRPRTKPESDIARRLRLIAEVEGYDHDQLAAAFGVKLRTMHSWLYDLRKPKGSALILLNLLYDKAQKKKPT